MDAAKHQDRNSGDLCTKHRGAEMIYRGCLCEGANVTAPIGRDFILWTRCGQRDVPADSAHEGDIREVTCPTCLHIWNEENGQLGVGA